MLRGSLGCCRHKNRRVFPGGPPRMCTKKGATVGPGSSPQKGTHTADKKERGGEDGKVCKSFFFLSLLQSRGGRPQRGKEGRDDDEVQKFSTCVRREGKKGGKEESSPGEKERSHCGRKGQLRGEGNLYKCTKVRTLEEEKGQRTRARTFGSGMALSDDDGGGGQEHTKTKQMVEQKRQGNHKLAFPSPFLLLSAHQSGQTEGKLLPEEEVGRKEEERGLHGKAAIAASFSLTRVG